MKALPRAASKDEIQDTFLGKIPIALYLVKNEELFRPLSEYKKDSIKAGLKRYESQKQNLEQKREQEKKE